MRFDMTKPCEHCPFRNDIKAFLRKARIEELRDQLTENRTFACHETTSVTKKQPRIRGKFAKRINQHCAGALILLRKTNTEGAMQQIAERLGLYDPSILDMGSPVFDSWDDMVEAQDD